MMRDEELSPAEQAEILRKKQKYREWIRSGRIRLSPERAAQLLGPDSLFHLYAQHSAAHRPKRSRKKGRS